MKQFVVSASGGSPVLIHVIVTTLASKNITDVTVARQALDLCWPDGMMRYWMDALDGADGAPECIEEAVTWIMARMRRRQLVARAWAVHEFLAGL